MKSHARRRIDVTEIRSHCPEHPDCLFIRAEGCPLCASLRRIKCAMAAEAAPVVAAVAAPKRHPWKGAR